MKVSVQWFEGKYPSFNVSMHRDNEKDAFLEIKGCRIMHSEKGEFVSWPATKNEKSGKYWNHVYADKRFAEHILRLAKETQPKLQEQKTQSENKFQSLAEAKFEDDIPW